MRAPRPSTALPVGPRLLGLAAFVLLGGCGDDPFGFEAATRFSFDAVVPLTVRLPPEDLPALPVTVRTPIHVDLPIDVAEELRGEGYVDEADALVKNRSRIRKVTVRSVTYEVPAPNLNPAGVGPVGLTFGPAEGREGEAFRLGETVAIPPRTPIATREVDGEPGGLDAIGPVVSALTFTLSADTEVEVPAGVPILTDTVVVLLWMELRFELDLL